MIYAACNLELGTEDAYERVLDGEHRDTVKQTFNAMVQASTALTSKPIQHLFLLDWVINFNLKIVLS